MKNQIEYAYDSNTTHKYRGWVMLTTFESDPGKHKSFEYEVDFDNPDLFQAREAGLKWYFETLEGIQREGKYYLPFAPPENFVKGENAAFFLTLSIVECSERDEQEYEILGESDDIVENGREVELMALNCFLIKQQ